MLDRPSLMLMKSDASHHISDASAHLQRNQAKNIFLYLSLNLLGIFVFKQLSKGVPIWLMFIEIFTQPIYRGLVLLLFLSVSLRMIDGNRCKICSKERTQLREKLNDEFCTIVAQQRRRYSIWYYPALRKTFSTTEAVIVDVSIDRVILFRSL